MARSKNTSTDGSASKEKVTASTTSKVSNRNKSLKPKMIDKASDTNGFTVERQRMQSITFAKMQEILQ